MSDTITISTKKFGIAVGVVKYDYQIAGYPDVMRKAQELMQDENFLQLIVRKVSKENWGISFILKYPNEQEGIDIWGILSKKFEETIGKPYAVDVDLTNHQKSFLVNKSFEVVD